MAMDTDVKKLGTLGVVLLGLMIIIGVFFLVSDLWQENLCENADYTWSGGTCVDTNTTEVTLDSITNVNLAITAFVTALGFLSLIVIVAIAKILLKMVKGF